MAFRHDITVDWQSSPRIITVLAPSTETTVQDLVDTLREMETWPDALDEPHIINAAGKEPLGGGVRVGITATLQNAQLAFEARPGPDWVQCKISGGNLVAVDTDGNEIPAVFPTAYTQIVQANSSSATLQELEMIQYSSFNGGVSLDINSSYSGTEYPVGTPQQPVNNLADAMTIAQERGFFRIFVLSDMTIDTGGDYRGMVFVGDSISKVTMNISSDANVENCEFYDATITGVLDGNCVVKHCRILDLTYIYGVVEKCLLGPGTITLGGDHDIFFLDCWSAKEGINTPVIDCGGAGQAIFVRNYNGEMKFTNKTGPEKIVIDLNSGHIILDSTVTNGNILVRGLGTLEDNSNGASVDYVDLINNQRISDATWDNAVNDHIVVGSAGETLRNLAYCGAVYIDTDSGVSGTNYPIGSKAHPVNNLADALVIASKLGGIKEFYVTGSIALTQTMVGYRFVGLGALENCIIDLNNQDISSCILEHVTLIGQMNGDNIQCSECVLDSVSGLDGIIKSCGIKSSLGIKSNGTLMGKDIAFVNRPTIVDFKSVSASFVFSGEGYVRATNMTNGSYIQYGGFAGRLEIDSTCTNGIVIGEGPIDIVNNGTNMTITDWTLSGLHGSGNWEGSGSAEAIADAVWDEARADHTVSGSFGATSEWAGNVDNNAIANAVWTHTDAEDLKTKINMKLSELQAALQGADNDTLESISEQLDDLVGSISKPRIRPLP